MTESAREFAKAPGVSQAKPGHKTTALLQADFLRRLAGDSQFNALVLPAIAAHLRHSGTPVVAKLGPPPRVIIPIDTAIKVAVRFFYPDLIVQDRILTHVCTVINAVRELRSRNLALEALAFAAIMGEVTRADSSRLETDFAPARDLMNALDAPGPREVRLSRAQGVMWGVMARSVRLRDVLLAEALRQRDILPFELQVQ